MYFVDRGKIEEILTFMEGQMTAFAGQAQWKTAIEQAALERIAQMVIESVLDVGNAMIDGFIMRDPGSYEDIIDILEDEKVIEKEAAASLKAAVALRKMLVQQYTAVDHTEVERTLSEHISAFEQFPEQVRKYLTDELGPVSAFKP
ncbi:type VII toxin-antitoxin system HepT family RNase toxin [Pseudobacillus badius]|uniref:type VII toxin-antitoxin system HepT family RNase toxin n=1 Tax=Bacillus badius TaxID=1455 RepID=UPI0007B03B37|nr:DUF86 domain-containing protein [Bacillus badius]KZN99513.1 hypothetical protein A4244_18390 [Bacillus badius]OCS85350.1 hypothetical protein A6M11_18405 [Bacillus badius]OVE50401.1 hypothetical protein B1A98_15950 [Bacillus badius]TDW01302.1 uncharacterized protein YutE (UPF0331/DUF86 family) [Bacillus badius]UAT30053.1 DUF86 domain-containing protein [Bacillus badius]